MAEPEPVTRLLTQPTEANACFFRSTVEGRGRKALVQITERCNLHCAHCFVSSTSAGSDISLNDFTQRVIPRLIEARVQKITLTGGEPFAHPDLLAMSSNAVDAGMSVGICTNATQIADAQIDELAALDAVHVNVSFDGFSAQSHGRFRGNPQSFMTTVQTTRRLAAVGLLQGILSTPNLLTAPEEYAELAQFARELGAEYLLMNPLSSFGRGERSRRRLAAGQDRMRRVREQATAGSAGALELVPIRFPNDDRPLSGCVAGSIIYVFVDGSVAACPYLVFAARTAASQYAPEEFLIGNVLQAPIAEALDRYRFHERYTVGANATCGSCQMSPACGKGCPAAVVARGERIGARDTEICPVP